MIITITLLLASLVALNFLLLIFSCNKTTKKTVTDNSVLIRKSKPAKAVKPTKQLATRQLAPTGS